MIAAVVDCSVLVQLMMGGGTRAVRSHPGLAECLLAAPQFVDVEFLSALRGLARKDPDDVERIEQLLNEFHRLEIERFDHARLTWDAWRLRHRMSACDAMYVALAAELKMPLVTADARLARGARDVCDVRLLDELRAA